MIKLFVIAFIALAVCGALYGWVAETNKPFCADQDTALAEKLAATCSSFNYTTCVHSVVELSCKRWERK